MKGQKDLESMKKGLLGSKIKEKIDTSVKIIHFGEKIDQL